MKLHKIILILLCSLAVANAQTASSPTSVTAQAEKKSKSKSRRISRPPASKRARPMLRISTAQRMNLSVNKPLPKTLPAFSAKALDGTTVSAATASPAATGHWLLLYRKAQCLPCDRLMVALAASQSPTLKVGSSYVIVVDGASPDALDKVRGAYPQLGDATWLADQSRQAWKALKPTGSPILYAMDGTSVAWSIPGTLATPTRVEAAASAWLAAPSRASLEAATRAKIVASSQLPASSVSK